jgi:hypothetical protein
MIRRSPAVTGAVALDGVPAVGASGFVQFNANESCNGSSLRTVTDKRGAFAIPVGRSFEWYSPIQLGHRGYGWRLCFEYQGRYYLAYQEMGWGIAPKNVHLECELAVDPYSAESGVFPALPCKRHEP